MDNIVVSNFTNFFNRERLLYSLGKDIRLSKPIPLMRLGYIALFLVLYTFPIIFLFGFHASPYFILFAIVPPILLGHFAGSPIWLGMSLFNFLRVQATYIVRHKIYADTIPVPSKREAKNVSEVIWVGRRRELIHLSEENA